MAGDKRTIPWQLAGLGMELGMMIGGMAYLGYLADRHFGSEPWLTLTGVLTAMAGGTYTLFKQVQASETTKRNRKP